jgi:SAM-dependent methyltransferase
MDPTPPPARFDAGTYGRSFADVYDRWYPADPDTDAAVARVASLAGANTSTTGRVLELGVGTGRLAVPLAARGHEVVGIDSSEEMLGRLAANAAASGVDVRAVHGDVGDPAAWPQGPFDVVVAAFNLVFNLAEDGAQQRLFDAAAHVIDPSGSLVVEAFLPAPLEMDERRLEVRAVTVDSVVLIATDASADDGVVVGQHIELRDGEPVRLRPWRIRTAGTDQIDEWAATAGLVLTERHADWVGGAFDPHGTAHVSVYRPAA